RGYASEMSAERVVDQVISVQEKYGAKFVRFNEDNFTRNRKRLREVCRLLIDKKVNIKWACESRCDLNEADIALMRKAGCVAMGLGIESGSQRILDFVHKGIKVEQIEKSFWLLVKYHIRIVLYFIYGFPTETVDDFQATQDLIRRLDNPSYLYSRFIPIPGSVLWDYCIENKLLTAPKTLEEWPDFCLNYGHKYNLSQVPESAIEEANERFRNNYAWQRFRFTLKHDPGYFWIIFTNPAKFYREMRELLRYHQHINKLKKVRAIEFARMEREQHPRQQANS